MSTPLIIALDLLILAAIPVIGRAGEHLVMLPRSGRIVVALAVVVAVGGVAVTATS